MMVRKRWAPTAALLATAVGLIVFPALGETLPKTAPRPQPRSSAAPTPDEPPAKSGGNDEGAPAAAPATTPVEPTDTPTPRPKGGGEDQGPPADAGGPGAAEPAEAPAMEVPPRPEVSPAEEVACRERLTRMGAEFAEQPPLSDPSGCAVAKPLSLKSLSPTIAVQPPVTVNCSTAEALARFVTQTASPLAEQELGSPVKAVGQASGYVCRPRNGTHKLSEHAFGNAVDIASFTLADGTTVEVTATRNPEQSTFLSKLRSAACGPFKTVLGPGSDADHALHFHLDLAKRRSDKPFCQ